MEPLDDAALREAVADLPGWRVLDGHLTRTFELASFPAAVAFVVAVGFEAEARNHHPRLTIDYARVAVALVTHDAGGITTYDIELAAAIDALGSG